MADTQTLLDNILGKLHYDGTRYYTRTEGKVDYLDGRMLARPADMPKAQKILAAVFVVAGVIIAAIILNNTVISAWRESMMAEQTIASNLTRQASIETIPQMASLINLDDASIKAEFESQGYQVFDASEMYDSNDMTLYKLPADVSLQEATLLYTRGMGALDATDATRLLNGSWYFASDRVNGTSMVVRYADFSTADPEIAVRNAIAKEGFDVNTITESGIDDSQNTYSMGSVDADGTACTWKVSALPLTDMYSIRDLPEDACYVGVRITAT